MNLKIECVNDYMDDLSKSFTKVTIRVLMHGNLVSIVMIPFTIVVLLNGESLVAFAR